MSIDLEILATRFGYGPLPDGSLPSADDMLAKLEGPDHIRSRYPIQGLDHFLPLMQQQKTLAKVRNESAANFDALKQVRASGYAMTEAATRAMIARMLDNDDMLRERLLAFWVNHFAVAAKHPITTYLPSAMAEEALRPNLTGHFSDLLIAATTHPGMVAYLDQDRSVGPNSLRGDRKNVGLNENLAREVMELHSLGVSAPYSQTDVRQMALLLTGLTFEPDTGAIFDPKFVEPGAETVLGKTYDGRGLQPIRDVLTALARRKETAVHICTKLARHFIADVPPQRVVDAMVKAYVLTDGTLMAVYREMLHSDAATQGPTTKARWPQDWLVTCLRALGVTGADVMDLADGPFKRMVTQAMKAMGQPWQLPPGPNGFAEEADAWINPPLLAARISWAMTAPARLIQTMPQPTDLAKRALGARASQALLWAADRAETRSDGVGLVLASVEMNRR